MNKFLITFAALVGLALIAGAVYGGWYYQNGKYDDKSSQLATDIETAQAKVDELKLAEDEKGYSPSDVVKNFTNEFKNDSMERALLYVSSSKQNMDIKSAYGFSKDLDQINLTQTDENVSGESAEVIVKGFYVTEDAVFQKTFSLTKENGLWKINQII